MSWRNTFRIILALVQVYLIINWHLIYGFESFMQYLTNWGICLVLGNLCVSAYLPYCKDYRKMPGLLAFNHITLSLAIVAELIVTAVYWAFVYKEVMRTNAGNPRALIY